MKLERGIGRHGDNLTRQATAMVRTSYVYDYKALSENLTRGNGGRDSNTGSTRNPEQGPF